MAGVAQVRSDRPRDEGMHPVTASGNRRTIYVGNPLRRLLSRRGPESSVTEQANAAARRYLAICRASAPEFDANEWCAVLDALNGIGLRLNYDEYEAAVRSIPIEFAEAERLGDLSAKWQVDGAGMAAQLAEMTFPRLAAVAEVAECFWAHAAESTEEALRRALVDW